MLAFLPSKIKGLISAILFGLNTTFWCVLLYPFVLLKLITPSSDLRRLWSKAMVAIGEKWIAFNGFEIRLMQGKKLHWDVEGLDGLNQNSSYLVCANHQSWVDIVVLQKIFNRRIPFLRFFLKKQLLYVPLLGGAWWALDFPFMRRYSKSYLHRHPEKRGRDLETTRKACEKFRDLKISILNFAEGTRFTREKHDQQHSPFKHLLLPKSGGMAAVLDSMGRQFDALIDVTIHYPKGAVSLWELFCGKLDEVVVRVRRIQIPTEFRSGDCLADPHYRERMQAWVRQIWLEKDALLDSLARRPDHLSSDVI